MHVILFILSSMAVFSCGAILTALWLRAELEQSRADYSAAIEDAENWRAAHDALQQQYRDLQEAFITSQVNLLQEAMKTEALIEMLAETPKSVGRIRPKEVC